MCRGPFVQPDVVPEWSVAGSARNTGRVMVQKQQQWLGWKPLKNSLESWAWGWPVGDLGGENEQAANSWWTQACGGVERLSFWGGL